MRVRSSNSQLCSIRPKSWVRAEKFTRDIIQNVLPTTVSEKRRKALIDYVQRLIRGSLHCEVFSYGSVPLKTYLPDGDLDFTTFGGPRVDDSFAVNMVSILKRESKRKDAEFTIEHVQLIPAEVKLVKCIIQNIVVDISFNQIGGLGSLCFLEKVDKVIGKDHLFKRSIILIKAWCYYESRILGAYHGLISTYALETLILYIFHLFHSALDGPLAVLYKFLDYFSKFDWENYCVTLAGPARLSSLPEIVVEMPQTDGGDLLLSDDFIRDCVGKFSVASKVGETNSRAFQQKHFNIVDPLKENNNLGRSVSKGNFYRIRSALTYGARKLGRILLQSEDAIADELNNFFSNILRHHGSSSGGFNSSSRMKSNQEEGDQEYAHRPSGDTACSNKQSIASSNNDDSTNSASLVTEANAPVMMKPFFAPHLYFTKKNQNSETKRHGDKVSCSDDVKLPSASGGERLKPLNDLADLNGDYDYHFSCLQYGQWCYEQSALSMPPLPPSPFQVNVVQQPSQCLRNGFSHGRCDGFIPNRHTFYTMNQPLLVPSFVFGFEDMPKKRGTGTCFPNKNRPPHGYRHSRGMSHPANNAKKVTLEDAREAHFAIVDQIELNQYSSHLDKRHQESDTRTHPRSAC